MIDSQLYDLAKEVISLLREKRYMLATAESCTGGLIAGTLTAVPGSSDIVERGFVTYSNEAKTEMLGVDAAVIATHGAVSEPVARAMAASALARSRASMAVSVTGVAGPGQSERKPAGLVFIGCAIDGREIMVEEHRFSGDRTTVRRDSVVAALTLVLKQTRYPATA